MTSFCYFNKNCKSDYFSKTILYNHTILDVYQWEILSNLSTAVTSTMLIIYVKVVLYSIDVTAMFLVMQCKQLCLIEY